MIKVVALPVGPTKQTEKGFMQSIAVVDSNGTMQSTSKVFSKKLDTFKLNDKGFIVFNMAVPEFVFALDQ